MHSIPLVHARPMLPQPDLEVDAGSCEQDQLVSVQPTAAAQHVVYSTDHNTRYEEEVYHHDE